MLKTLNTLLKILPDVDVISNPINLKPALGITSFSILSIEPKKTISLPLFSNSSASVNAGYICPPVPPATIAIFIRPIVPSFNFTFKFIMHRLNSFLRFDWN